VADGVAEIRSPPPVPSCPTTSADLHDLATKAPSAASSRPSSLSKSRLLPDQVGSRMIRNLMISAILNETAFWKRVERRQIAHTVSW
jgi:hypothetical protein